MKYRFFPTAPFQLFWLFIVMPPWVTIARLPVKLMTSLFAIARLQTWLIHTT